MVKEPKILAIDPATSTGYAIYNGCGLGDKKEIKSNIESGTWKCGTCQMDESSDMRLIRLESHLNKISEHLGGIDIVVFEAARNMAIKSQRALVVHAELQSIIKKWCMSNKVPYKGYSPVEIKKHATGSGAAKKEEMVKAAKEKYGVKTETNDEADALCLLYLAIEQYSKTKITINPE